MLSAHQKDVPPPYSLTEDPLPLGRSSTSSTFSSDSSFRTQTAHPQTSRLHSVSINQSSHSHLSPDRRGTIRDPSYFSPNRSASIVLPHLLPSASTPQLIPQTPIAPLLNPSHFTPAFNPQELLFLATSGTVFAVSKRTGAHHWLHNLGPVSPACQGLASLLPSPSGTTLFCGFGSHIVALDTSSGEVKSSRRMEDGRRFDLNVAYVSAERGRVRGATWGKLVYVGSGMWVKAVIVKTGSVLWKTYLDVAGEVGAATRIVAAPYLLYDDGVLYCGVLGCVVAVDAMTGAQIWQRSFLPPSDRPDVSSTTHEVTLATCATNDGSIYDDGQGDIKATRCFTAGTNRKIVMIDEDGKELQRTSLRSDHGLNSHVFVSPAGGDLVFAASDGILHLFSTRQKIVMWSSSTLAMNNIHQLTVLRPLIPHPTTGPIPPPRSRATSKDLLLLLLSNDTLHAVSATDPTITLWTFDATPSATPLPPNSSIRTDVALLGDHRILIATGGKVRALDLQGKKLWTNNLPLLGSHPVTVAGEGVRPGSGRNRSGPIGLAMAWRRVKEFGGEGEARMGMSRVQFRTYQSSQTPTAAPHPPPQNHVSASLPSSSKTSYKPSPIPATSSAAAPPSAPPPSSAAQASAAAARIWTHVLLRSPESVRALMECSRVSERRKDRAAIVRVVEMQIKRWLGGVEDFAGFVSRLRGVRAFVARDMMGRVGPPIAVVAAFLASCPQLVALDVFAPYYVIEDSAEGAGNQGAEGGEDE
ncbi:quinon protein alcohol dehydrogenase-like superfamily, partial [Blyttiomyces helicus]